MNKIFIKELKLSASILSYLFILFGFMFFLPGYPVLCGVFFITLGIFQSYQNYRLSNDIVFSALLPISKNDVVKGKYIFSCFIEICGFIVMTISTIIRMAFFNKASVYVSNALMPANFYSLGLALLIFGLFNIVFIKGFFKTAYKFGRPFVTYIIAAFTVITAGEALIHFPNLDILKTLGFENMVIQTVCLVSGAVLYALLTLVSYRKSIRLFEKIDL